MSDRPGLRQAVTAFRYRNFTIFWTGALISNSGSWLQNVTVPFVVFAVTGSAAWVGAVGFMQFVPIVITSPLGGVIADRFSRRGVLIATQAAQAVVAIALALLWASGSRSLAPFVALIALSGLITGLNIPSWQAFVSELVPREVLLNAVTLNSAQFNFARLFGPALGGLILATLGAGWAFAINAASFVAVILALLAIRVAPRVRSASRGKVLRELGETIAYVGALRGIMAFAREVFEVGDFAYGLMGAALGLGAVLASPFVAGPGSGLRRSRLITVAVVVYGVAMVAFGLAPTYVVALVAVAFMGGGYLAIASTLNTTIQLQVSEARRGKVLSLYIIVLTVALPIGMLAQGLLAQAVGPRAIAVASGLLFLGVFAWLRLATDDVARMDDRGDLADEVEVTPRP
jgi:MFS family permease